MKVWVAIDPLYPTESIAAFSSEELAQDYIDTIRRIDDHACLGPYAVTIDEISKIYVYWHVYLGRDGTVINAYQLVQYEQSEEEKDGEPWNAIVHGSADTFERALELAQEALDEIKQEEDQWFCNPKVPIEVIK